MLPQRRMPLLAIAAGTLLACLAIGLALWSKALLKSARYADCGREASGLTRGLDQELHKALRLVIEHGERPPEVLAVFTLGPDSILERDPPDADDPAPRLLQSARGFRGQQPLPLSEQGERIPLAATWVPAADGEALGLLVQWNVTRIEAELLRPLLEKGDAYQVALLLPGQTKSDLSFRPHGISRPAPPFAFWRVGVGLRDSDSTRRALRIQTLLLGLLAGWLLVVLAGSVAISARRERVAATRREARDRFLARATHELQTPLALLRAAAETIQRGAAERPQDVARCADIMVREEERLTRTIRRLLRYLRLEGSPDPMNDTVRIGAEVERAAEDDRAALEAQGLTLELNTADLELVVPRGLMADAVSELLANARKYATGASRVTLTLERTPDGARLVVSDDGPGLDAKTREGLFQPWSGTDPGSKSSGLGLALIREGLAQIDATIRCDPAEKGARFVIEVPANDAGK